VVCCWGCGKSCQRKCSEDRHGWDSAIHGITFITSRGVEAPEPIADAACREHNLRQLATERLVAACLGCGENGR